MSKRSQLRNKIEVNNICNNVPSDPDPNMTGPTISCMNCCNTAIALPKDMAIVLNGMDDDKFTFLKKQIKDLEEEVEYLKCQNNNYDEITSDICRILKTDLDCIVHDVNDLEDGMGMASKWLSALKDIRGHLEDLGI